MLHYWIRLGKVARLSNEMRLARVYWAKSKIGNKLGQYNPSTWRA
jgi:hypothetical protein